MNSKFQGIIIIIVLVLIGFGIWKLTTTTSRTLSYQEGLPDVIEQTRQELFKVAGKRDYDALAELIEPGNFKYTFGTDYEGGFAQYFRDYDAESGTDSFLMIQTLLAMPYGTQFDIYTWPSFFITPPNQWTDEDIALLETIATPEEIAWYREFGGYAGWRLGIRNDGTWIYFIAGD